MGPAFVILFWLIVAGIGALFCGSLLALFIFGRRRKLKWLQWLAGVPLAFSCIGALVFATVVVVGFYKSTRPHYVFKDVFSQSPSAAVTNIKSRSLAFGDSGVIYLRFDCSQAEFDKLRSNGFSQIAPNIAKECIQRDFQAAPEWWRPHPESGTQCYEAKGERPPNRFSSQYELLLYNPQTKTAYYGFSGID